MKKALILSVTAVMAFSLVGCSSIFPVDTVATTTPKPVSTPVAQTPESTPTAQKPESTPASQKPGDTTISFDMLIMTANYAPGGEMTLEDYENAKAEYKIYYSGKVTDENGESVKLSEEDMDRIMELYTLLCTENLEVTNTDACDYPDYQINVYQKNAEYVCRSNGMQQSEVVEEVFDIVWPYFNEK